MLSQSDMLLAHRINLEEVQVGLRLCHAPCTLAGAEAERTCTMLVRLYAAEDGQSHFEDLDLHGWPAEWDMHLETAEIRFRRRPPGRSMS